MASQAQNSAPQDGKPRAGVRRQSPFPERAGGERRPPPRLRAQGHGVRAGSGPPPRTGRNTGRGRGRSRRRRERSPRTKRKRKRTRLVRKGGVPSHLPCLLAPEPKVPQPPLTHRLRSRAPAPPNRKRPLAPPPPPRQRPPDQSATTAQRTQSFLGSPLVPQSSSRDWLESATSPPARPAAWTESPSSTGPESGGDGGPSPLAPGRAACGRGLLPPLLGHSA